MGPEDDGAHGTSSTLHASHVVVESNSEYELSSNLISLKHSDMGTF